MSNNKGLIKSLAVFFLVSFLSQPIYGENHDLASCKKKHLYDQEVTDCRQKFTKAADVNACTWKYWCRICIDDPETECLNDQTAKRYCKNHPPCSGPVESTSTATATATATATSTSTETQTTDSSTTSSQAQSEECSNLSSQLAMYDASIAEEEERLNRLKSERQEVEAQHSQMCN
jgi:hypothetical protein